MRGPANEGSGFEPGSVVDGRYRIDAPVTAGGFGRIFRAWHLALNVPVALKVLRAERLGPEHPHAIRHFLEEARLVAQLKHPNIVGALDAGTWPQEDGQRAPYIVFEWCEGRTLRETLDASAHATDWRTTIQWMAPLVDAAAYAHERGVLHRDIKPSNVMMVAGRGLPEPRLLDFGIGKMMDANGPASARMPGNHRAFSFRYAAPEQLYGERTGPWTDVHALGLILTELVVGRRAYDGDAETEVARQILATFRPTPASFGVDVGPLEPVLQGALSLDPATRYRDARALQSALASLDRLRDAPLHLTSSGKDAPASTTMISAPGAGIAAPGAGIIEVGTGNSLAPNAADRVARPAPSRRTRSPAMIGLAALSAAAIGLAGLGLVARPWPPLSGGERFALRDRGMSKTAAEALARLTVSPPATTGSDREQPWSWEDWKPSGTLTSTKLERRAVAAGVVLTRYTSSLAPTFRVKGYVVVEPDGGQGTVSFYEGKTDEDIVAVAKSLEGTDSSAVHVDGNTMVWVMLPEPSGSKLAEALLARIIAD